MPEDVVVCDAKHWVRSLAFCVKPDLQVMHSPLPSAHSVQPRLQTILRVSRVYDYTCRISRTFTVTAAVQEKTVRTLGASGTVARRRPARVTSALSVRSTDTVLAVARRRKVLDDRLEAPAGASHTVVALCAVGRTRLTTRAEESRGARLARGPIETGWADALSGCGTHAGASTWR